MQEQERVASEEAEKRLKAALTAKREPSASASRVASPTQAVAGTAPEQPSDSKPSDIDPVLEPKPPIEDTNTSDDVVMDATDAAQPMQVADVSVILCGTKEVC
jgi:THO complex subunit 2